MWGTLGRHGTPAWRCRKGIMDVRCTRGSGECEALHKGRTLGIVDCFQRFAPVQFILQGTEPRCKVLGHIESAAAGGQLQGLQGLHEPWLKSIPVRSTGFLP